MSAAPVTVALIGCGRLAQRGYLPALGLVPAFELAAVCDTDAARREEAVATAGRLLGGAPRAFGDAGALLREAAPGIAIVAAPTRAHLPLARAATGAGVRTLVEKPPAADVAQAMELAALEPEPLVSFNRRFLQGAELRDRIPAEGWVELDLHFSYRRSAWGPHEAGDPALLDAGIHLIDLAIHLTGSRPLAVRRARLTSEEAWFELELGRGRARIHARTNAPYREEIRVADRAGRVICASRLSRLRGLARRARGGGDPLVASLAGQLEAVAQAEAGRGPVELARAADGLAAMLVAQAAQQSAGFGGAEVTIEPGGPPTRAARPLRGAAA